MRYDRVMLAQQRRSAIVDMVRASGGVSVADLATHLDVSASTIRRDLNALDRQGMLQRVRGGEAADASGNRAIIDLIPASRAPADTLRA